MCLFSSFVIMCTALAPVRYSDLVWLSFLSVCVCVYTYVWRSVGMRPTRRFTRLHYSDLVALAANWFLSLSFSALLFTSQGKNEKKIQSRYFIIRLFFADRIPSDDHKPYLLKKKKKKKKIVNVISIHFFLSFTHRFKLIQY
jgi:hypothetical protein